MSIKRSYVWKRYQSLPGILNSNQQSDDNWNFDSNPGIKKARLPQELRYSNAISSWDEARHRVRRNTDRPQRDKKKVKIRVNHGNERYFKHEILNSRLITSALIIFHLEQCWMTHFYTKLQPFFSSGCLKKKPISFKSLEFLIPAENDSRRAVEKVGRIPGDVKWHSQRDVCGR